MVIKGLVKRVIERRQGVKKRIKKYAYMNEMDAEL
jgi:hypothetical protein